MIMLGLVTGVTCVYLLGFALAKIAARADREYDELEARRFREEERDCQYHNHREC